MTQYFLINYSLMNVHTRVSHYAIFEEQKPSRWEISGHGSLRVHEKKIRYRVTASSNQVPLPRSSRICKYTCTQVDTRPRRSRAGRKKGASAVIILRAGTGEKELKARWNAVCRRNSCFFLSLASGSARDRNFYGGYSRKKLSYLTYWRASCV